MPLELSNLQTNTATATVDYGDAGTLTIVYRPGNVTERTIRQLTLLEDRTAMNFEENMAALNSLLLRFVVSWDLTNQGEPVPLTAEALADVPIDVRADVLAAVTRGSRIDPKPPTSTQPGLPASTARKAARSSRRRG